MTITPQEVRNTLALAESVRFKEIETDHLYDVKWFGEDTVLVRQCPPYHNNMEILSLESFVKRFDEAWG